MPYKIMKTPTVCVIKPHDDQFPEYRMKNIMGEAKNTVMEWKVRLQERMSKDTRNVWDMKYEERNSVNDNTSTCDVVIDFARKPVDPQEQLKVIGITEFIKEKSQSFITIYYLQINTCKKSDNYYIYIFPCYGNEMRTTDQIGTTLRHEFGHTLGLGHYSADNPEVTKQWAKNGVDAPSVMVPFDYENTKLVNIKPIDVEKVRSIYGEKGFLSPGDQTKIQTDSKYKTCEKYKGSKYDDCKKTIDKNSKKASI